MAIVDPTASTRYNEWSDDSNPSPETPSDWDLEQLEDVFSFANSDEEDEEIEEAERSGADLKYNLKTGAPVATKTESKSKNGSPPAPATEFSSPEVPNEVPKSSSISGAPQTKALPVFLKQCSGQTTSLKIRTDFCQGTLDFIAEFLLEAHNNKLYTEIAEKPPYEVGTCEFSPALTLENGQVVGADSIDGDKMSYISVSTANKPGEAHDALQTRLVPFGKILESATTLCDGNILLTSHLKHRTLLKLKKNSVDFTNVINFSNFFTLLGPKLQSLPEAPKNPTTRPPKDTGR